MGNKIVNKNWNKVQKLWFVLLGINTFVWSATAVYTPFMSAYYTGKGISASGIGLLLAIGPMISIFIQPLWAKLSDCSGKRKNVAMIVIAASAIALWGYYLGEKFALGGFMLSTFVAMVFISAVLPLCDAMVLKKCDEVRFSFAYIRMGGTIGFAVFTYLAGKVLVKYSNSLFMMGSIMYLVLLLMVTMLPRERAIKVLRYEKIRRGHEAVFDSKEIAFVLAFAFLSTMGLNFNTYFLGSYLTELGYDQSVVGLTSMLSAVSEIPALLYIHKLIEKWNTFTILCFSGVTLALRIFMVASGNFPLMISSSLLQSVSYMPSYYCIITYVNQHILPEKNSQGQGILTMIQTGLGSVVSSIGGGLLIEKLGLKISFQIMGTFILLGSVVIILLYRYWYQKKGGCHLV